jgi:hypothetical protein
MDPIIQSPATEILINAESSREDFFRQASEALGETPETSASDDAAEAAAMRGTPAAPAKAAAPQPQQQGVPKLPEAPKIQTPPAPPTGQEERAQEPPAEYEKLTGSKGDQWKQLHSIKTAAQLRVQELEAKLAARAQNEPPEEFVQKVKTLQQERDEYLSKLEAVAAERSPRFQAQFQPRIDSALQLAKGAVGPAQAQTVEQIFGMQDSEYRTQLINDVSSNLTDFQKGKFFNSIAEIDRVQGEKAALTSRGSEVWKQWQEEDRQVRDQQTAQAKQIADSAFDAELADWKASEFFGAKEGNPTHNQAVQQRIETAKSIFNGNMDYGQLARATLWASLGPDLVRDLHGKAARISELESQLTSRRAAEPGAGVNSAPFDQGEDLSKMSYSEAISRAVSAEGILPGR